MASGSGYSQSSSQITVTTPLGEDVLLLRSATITEGLSMPFECELDLLSEDDSIKSADLLGESVTVRLDVQEESQRFFNGLVRRFSHVGFEGRLARYQATLAPWLWLLTRTSDCRIFQKTSILDIIKEVLGDYGFPLETRLYEDSEYRRLEDDEICVQYRETDFNFVSRLMETEGVYYFFEHEEGKHTLVLADSYSSHKAAPGYETIRYHAMDQAAEREQDFVFDWTLTSAIRTGAFVHDDFDFKNPSGELRTSSTITRKHSHADLEVYDYPGEYVSTSLGDRYAKVRAQELQADHEIVQAEGYARGVAAGSLFTLSDYPRKDQNREYLILSAQHFLQRSDYQTTGSSQGGDSCRSSFTAMSSDEVFRPPRLTPKPVVQGPQTAIVVGEGGEEISTDKYGRVKVQFHWDREGSADENSSCPVRVSQNWAGKQWGGMFIPHAGHEVIVDFLEGDPDRPIIIGRVYNANNMPPEELPTHQTKSIIRDYGDNEMVWDGKDGEQFIRINQKCGNQLVMNGKPGEEGITLSDKFGNMLVMDSVGKTITLKSPSKDSGIVLGKSIHHITGSNSFRVTGGVLADVCIGNQTLAFAGSKITALIGHHTDLFVGSKTSISIGHTFEWAKATKIVTGESSSYAVAGKNNTITAQEDIVLDADKTVWVLGGEKDKAMIKANDEALLMSYSDGSTGRDSVPRPSRAAVAGPIFAAGAHAIGTASPIIDAFRGISTEPIKKGDKPHSFEKWNAGLEVTHSGFNGLLAGAVAWKLGSAAAADQEAKRKADHGKISMHESPDGQIKLHKEGTLITAGESCVEIEKDKQVTIKAKSGQISVTAEDGEIVLICKGGEPIKLDAKVLKVDAEINQKNFSSKN